MNGSIIRSVCALALLVLPAACAPAGNGDGSGGGDETAAVSEATEAPATETAPDSEYPPVGYAWIIFGADTVTAEVARSQEERSQGLMYREEMAEDAGMLFIFPDNRVRSFWMQNTYLPLDIAFMDPSFRIVDIQQMEPMTTDSYMSRAPAMYALEVNQGWFEAHGVEVGATPNVEFGG